MSLALRPFVLPPSPRVKTPGSPPLAAAAEQPAINESLIERLVKLVPADVVAIYVPALGFDRPPTWPYYALVIAIAGTLLGPLLLFLDARSANERVPPLQYVVRTVAFVAWAFLIGDPLGAGAVNPLLPALVALVLPIIGERLLRTRST
jgi:hypothetical protein